MRSGKDFFYLAIVTVTPLDRLVSTISVVSVLLPFGSFLIKNKEAWHLNKWFVLYILNHFISEVVTATMSFYKMRNIEVGMAFAIVEGVFLLALYRYAFKSKALKALMLVL